MTELRDAWTDVADRLSALGLKVKLHAEEELSDPDREVTDACGRVRSAVEEIADALGDASRDPAVRADVRAVADALATAVTETVGAARSGLERRAS